MKKFMISCAVALCALAFASCSGEGCWKVQISYGSVSTETYVYGNSEDVDIVIEKAKQAAALIGITDDQFNVSRKKVKMAESDCK